MQTLATPGRHADGGGLYLVVGPGDAKRWVMLYRLAGKRREMGLGSALSVSLARARELAAEARAKIVGKTDPINDRRAEATAGPVTFADVAETFMADHAAEWRSAILRRQWRQTLQTQAATLWTKPIDAIETDDILALLRPMWQEKADTAKRIRGRIERILDAARAAGHRSGENPARWKGHLDAILPRAKKLTRGHHKAMAYVDVPSFYATLIESPAPSAAALRFIILTAARSGEVRGMVWGEVDMAEALWTVPAERMKAKRVHRVPLSGAAMSIVKAVQPENPSPAALVFPSVYGKVMSDMIFAMLLRRSGYPDITTHGFRSSFRDWAGNETDFARDLAEAALAHLVGDETERAYRRGDALTKRRHLMDAWAHFVASDKGAE